MRAFRLLPAIILLAAAPFAAAAQNNSSDTVGPPVLRDFDLPGTRSTPPPQTQPVPVTPPPVVRPPDTNTQQAQPLPSERPRPPAPPPVRTAPPAAAAPTEQAPDILAPAPVEAQPAPVQAAPVQPPVASPAPASPSSYWPWAVGAALLLAVGFFLLRRRRRAVPEQAEPSAPRPSQRPAVPAAPLPETPRPRLAVDLFPDKLTLTPTEARVDFRLVVVNEGDADARAMRIHARLFNASNGQPQELALFYALPFEAPDQGMTIPAGRTAQFNTQVVMPVADLRALQVEGRALYIPTIGVNILYDWGDAQHGQNGLAFLIGTQSAGASEGKMGAFRLDVGPRIYRTLGARLLAPQRIV